MADQIYLSLWFPDFRLESLPRKLALVLQQFESLEGSPRIRAATVYPLSWNESPIYQRMYGEDEMESSTPEAAVAEAVEMLHDDLAFEFEVVWNLWIAESALGLDPVWSEEPRIVRVIGFAPHFDHGAYEQNGHIRIDFGTDTPFIEEEVELDQSNLSGVRRNLQKLVHLTRAIEEKCAISSRLMWSDSGESLAHKVISRLQRLG